MVYRDKVSEVRVGGEPLATVVDETMASAPAVPTLISST